MRDPWDEFRMEEECREEKAVRHLYNPRKKSWRVDEVTVKMQDKVRTQVLCKHRAWVLPVIYQRLQLVMFCPILINPYSILPESESKPFLGGVWPVFGVCACWLGSPVQHSVDSCLL